MPKTPDYFHGKTIIITGAASGIGRATALIFAREGANVVCADLNEQGARETAAQINGPGRTLVLKTDVTAREQVTAMVRRAVETFGSVQFLFNSAGAAMRRSKFLDIDDDLLEKTFALNLKGTFYGMQAVLPHMLEKKFGVIVNIAGVSAGALHAAMLAQGKELKGLREQVEHLWKIWQEIKGPSDFFVPPTVGTPTQLP